MFESYEVHCLYKDQLSLLRQLQDVGPVRLQILLELWAVDLQRAGGNMGAENRKLGSGDPQEIRKYHVRPDPEKK